MIIALFPNTSKSRSQDIARDVCNFLTQREVTVVTEDDEAASIHAKPLSSISQSAIDFVITIGGDGTILRLMHRHPLIQAPIMAINLGGLGFMADIPLTEIYSSLDNLINGNYQIQSRLVMDGRMEDQNNFSVNEIVIHRAHNLCLVSLAIYVDDQYLNTFSADGIIIATPSGSTAYSLAAGGPIMTPELDALVITPICPHTISNKPIVLLPKREIRVEYISSHDPVEITFDGFSSLSMKTGQSLFITRSKRIFRLVNMPNHDYYSTLRTKLEWKGQLRA